MTLENLHAVYQCGTASQLECSIVPGFNDRDGHLAGTAVPVQSMPWLRGVRLLPFHPLGSDRAKRPSAFPTAGELAALDGAKLECWIGRLPEQGVRVLKDRRDL